MHVIQTIISYLAIAVAFITSIFSWGTKEMVPFTNNYTIPQNIPAYQTISIEQKTDWQAKWIWDKSNLTENNVWMCLSKKVDLSSIPTSLVAHVSADSKYWLYVNGINVVFEGSVKSGRDAKSCYYDSIDIAPYLKEGANTICALAWYWDEEASYSYNGSGQAGFLFEAIGEGVSITSDSTWKVKKHTAYLNKKANQPNYRLSEYSIYYDARLELGDWLSTSYDFSSWENATEYAIPGEGAYGKLYSRGIPLLKDYGLKDYENSKEYENYVIKKVGGEKLTLDIPYNAQFTPYLKIIAPKGKKIRITTENTLTSGAVSTTYVTKDGLQEFEALGWMNGEHVAYKIPKGVTIVALQYRETGYDSAFAGNFSCNDEFMNSLWQKSLRTLYVTMRDNFMDCPDRERAQWWGDATSEMIMTMYSMDSNAYLLYQKGVDAMLAHVDNSKVLQTVVPITDDYFELPVQQLAGIVGFLTYYEYTGDKAFIEKVYDASIDYLKLWEISENGLVVHREGSWDWGDWGKKVDITAIENAWVYYALSSVEEMGNILGKNDKAFIIDKKESIKQGYKTLWTELGFKSKEVKKPDDRANALAVLAGLATEDQYPTILNVLTTTQNASPYMEYYVLESLCKMGKYQEAIDRIKDRYEGMVNEDYSTLWEFWNSWQGTMNHAWSGGPLVIMSKHIAGITPLGAGYEKVKIEPQYSLYDNLNCTVPSVKGLITLDYKKIDGVYHINVTLPDDAKAILHVPNDAVVKINSKLYFQDGNYLSGIGDVEIV
ncbi:MAG: alpha-L-rhamnosidase N-terminal domain-containing protein [Clostridia bacterium]|nr:alpha-L-rhamnosidase N-terminal domain-containing protein [Clostridia bacterium]